MADDPTTTSSYRTPAADVPEPAPHERLARFVVPGLGPCDLGLGLGAPLRLGLDRQALRVTPGSGLLLRPTAPLPPLELRHLSLDLTTAAVDLGSPGLGQFEARAASLAATAVFQEVLPWQPGRSLLDVAIQNLPQAADGARRVFAKGPASVWVDPDARLDLTVTADALEVDLSHPVWLRVFGLAFGLVAVRYLFDHQKLELQGPHGHGLRNALLRTVAWIATRWLRKRLPAALAAPGYDPAADPQRRAHLLELISNLRGKPRPGAAPVPSDTSAAPAPSTSSPAPSDSPPDGLAARLRNLVNIRLSADDVPHEARMLVAIPLGARGTLALCTDRGADVLLRRRAARISLDAPAGLYLHVDALRQLSELRISHVAVQTDTLATELQTIPPLGSFAQAVVHHLARSLVPAKVPADVLRRLAALRSDDILFTKIFGESGAGVTIATPHSHEITVRHGADALELTIPGGLQLTWQRLDFLPDAEIRGLRYAWATGELQLDATPDLGEFGGKFVSQMLRHRAAPHLPKLLGFRGPDSGAPIDPAIAAAHPAVIVETTVPALGPLIVRLDPADPLTIALSVAALDVHSKAGIALLVPELELDLVFHHFRYEPRDRGLGGSAPLGAYLTELLTRLLESKALPLLQARLPGWKDAEVDRAWQIVAFPAGPLGTVRVALPAGAAIVAERTADALTLAIRDEDGTLGTIAIIPEKQKLVPKLGFQRLRWRPAFDEWTLTLDPPTGPLVSDLIKRLVHKFVPMPVLAQVTKYLALPDAKRIPPPSVPPPAPGPVLFETNVPQLGALKVAADPQRTVDLTLQRGAAAISFGAGITVRLPAIGFNVQLTGLQGTLHPFHVNLDSKPDAGPLPDVLLTHAARGFLGDFAARLSGTAQVGQDTLLVFGEGKPWGPLRVHVPTDGSVAVHLDRTLVRLSSKTGVLISGQSIDWLPDFQLHTLQYTFETGDVALEIGGIEENFYREAHAVGPVTQKLAAHLIKVLALPKLPPAAKHVGLRSFAIPAPPVIDPRQIGLYRVKLPGDYGDVFISMAPEDTVTVRASETEISVTSERGLLATLAGLRFQLTLRGARYHLQSGEIQVGGLGQLENALLEAIVGRQLRSIPQISSGTPDDVQPHLGSLLEQLPVDDKHRTVLFSHKYVNLLLLPGASLIIRLTAEGLSFTADPPIFIDGPVRIDYKFDGIRYSFPDGGFHLDIENAGGLLSGLFKDVAINQVEKRLNDLLKPLLPAAMRVPGYSLAGDPDSTEHVRQLVANFGTLKPKKK